MQIQLRQPEIVEALKQFIARQGIDLTHKEVAISFTAGRKNTGLSADLSIEDADIPGVEQAPVESVKPVLNVVQIVEAVDTPVMVEEPVPAAKTGTSSLFS